MRSKLLSAVLTFMLTTGVAIGSEVTVRLYPAPVDFAHGVTRKPDLKRHADPFAAPPVDDYSAFLLVKNTIEEFFPGRMYDVTMPLKENFGILTSAKALAWMNPKSSTLIVRGDEKDHELIEAFMDSFMWNPPMNIELSGKVVFSSPDKVSAPIAVSWETIGVSGKTSKTRMRSRDGIGLESEMEAIVGNDGYHIDLRIAVAATIGEEIYSTETEFTIVDGQTKALAMGVDAANARIARIEISVKRVKALPLYTEGDGGDDKVVAKIAPLLPQ